MSSDRLTQLLDFLKNSPGDAFILFAIAKEHEGLGNQEEALKHYLELTEKQPDYVGTYYHLGKLYEKQGAFEKAFSTYKTGMQVAKKMGDQHILSELAGAKLNLGEEEDFEEA